MKRIFTYTLITLAVAVILVACGNKNSPADKTAGVSYEDTVGFTAFQNWRAQNERADVNNYQTTAASNAGSAAPAKTVTHRRVSSNAPVASTTSKKKGWSKAAKGTAIGAGSGAILGAVINKKNRGLGAVIGGVIGGGAGYGIGRSMDKKDGRVKS